MTSDSDSDSDSEAKKPTSTKPKPVSVGKRRKTIEESRSKIAAKRTKHQDISDDEDEEDEKKGLRRSGRRKRKGDEDDDSLVCQETIPRSPVHTGVSGPGLESETKPVLLPATGDRTDRSRLEMPFATVPEAVGGAASRGAGGGVVAGVVSGKLGGLPASLAAPESPPGTPDSSVSGTSPAATRSSRPEGSKSPADSSEVDLESLSGRGKAGSEDSRLDVECSSSSDTRLGRGRRRQHPVPASNDKSSPPGKRKRKISVGRGRGKGRGRHSSGVGRPGRDDTDDSETPGPGRAGKGDAELNKLDRLDNAALAELAKPRQMPAKYNFYVDLSKLTYFLFYVIKVQSSSQTNQIYV